jgi:hypothetical protein
VTREGAKKGNEYELEFEDDYDFQNEDSRFGEGHD